MLFQLNLNSAPSDCSRQLTSVFESSVRWFLIKTSRRTSLLLRRYAVVVVFCLFHHFPISRTVLWLMICWGERYPTNWAELELEGNQLEIISACDLWRCGIYNDPQPAGPFWEYSSSMIGVIKRTTWSSSSVGYPPLLFGPSLMVVVPWKLDTLCCLFDLQSWSYDRSM